MNFKQKIKERGLIQKWVAKQIEIDPVLLNYYLNDVRPMPQHIADKLKSILK